MFASGQWHTVMVYARPLFEAKLPGIGLGAWDTTLLAAVVACALRPATWRGRVGPLDLALLASCVALVLWVLYGALRGGDLRQAQIQLNALMRMYVLYFVIHSAFSSSRDILQISWVILAAALYRAVACLAFFWFFARSGKVVPYPEAMTDHHDSTLWAAAIIGLVSGLLVSRRTLTRAFAAAGVLLLILAIHYNTRRVAWVELAGGLALLYVGMGASRLRKAIHRYAVVALPPLLLYVAVGWNQDRRVFAPVQQLKSVFADSTDPSNDARYLENRGLVVTLQSNKLLGTGFGHEFTEVSVLYSEGMAGYFPNYRYLPHNSLVGLVAFTGVVGFPIIWAFFSVSAFLAARAYSHARSPREQALSMAAFAIPFVYSAQAFGDMGIQSLKANVILAASIAAAARLAANTGAWPGGSRRQRRAAADPPVGALPPPTEEGMRCVSRT